MRNWHLILTVVVGFGTLVTVPSTAAEPKIETSAQRVNQLIDQLSSRRYEERLNAQEELVKIGLPALELLKAAAASRDMETRQRAAKLVSRLEQDLHVRKILQPTYVELKYDNQPLKAVLVDFSKKTGYEIQLMDPNLGAKKITLNTGKVTFWEAHDQLLKAARLTEATQQETKEHLQKRQNPQALPNGPVPDIRRNQMRQRDIQKKIRELQKQQQQEAEKLKEQLKRNQIQGKKAPEVKQELEKKLIALKQAQIQLQKEQAQAAARQQQQAIQILLQQQAQVQIKQIQLAQPGIQIVGNSIAVPTRGLPSNIVLLKSGKSEEVPTVYVGALRLRLLKDQKLFGNPAANELLLTLEVTPEPKLPWQGLDTMTIQKAIDTAGQELMQVVGNEIVNPNLYYTPNGFPQAQLRQQIVWNRSGYYAPPQQMQNRHFYLPIRLRKEDKPSKALKQVAGVLSARILTPNEALIQVKDVMKASGKTFKGIHGGSIKINSAKDLGNNRLEVDLILERLSTFIPANQNPINAPGQWGNNVIQLNNVQVINGRRRVTTNNTNIQGLTLLDTNNKPIQGHLIQSRWFANGNGVSQVNYRIQYTLKEGQKVGQLAFLGRRQANVGARFTFKDIDLSK